MNAYIDRRRSLTCTDPSAFVSKLRTYPTESQPSSDRRINLYLCPSPQTLSLIPSNSERSRGLAKFLHRREAKPPLLAREVWPWNLTMTLLPWPWPCSFFILLSLPFSTRTNDSDFDTPPMTASTRSQNHSVKVWLSFFPFFLMLCTRARVCVYVSILCSRPYRHRPAPPTPRRSQR